MEDEDEVDGDHIDYESTDSMTSTNQLPRDFLIPPKKEVEAKSPYLMLRSSNAAYYNCRHSISRENSRQVRSSFREGEEKKPRNSIYFLFSPSLRFLVI